MNTRLFSGDRNRPARDIEDAPAEMRVEFVDVAFAIAEQAEATNNEPTPHDIYEIICQTLGIPNYAANPTSGFRRRSQQYLVEAPWPRFYDVVLRLVQAFGNTRFNRYQAGVNSLFAAYGTAWDLTNNKQLERVLPVAIATEVTAAIDELRAAGYQAALQLFRNAKDAFDARPRRDRDAATNAFDAMEAAGKTRLGLPNATFGQVMTEVRNRALMNTDVQEILNRVGTLRNHHLGHGMVQPFALHAHEVDFVYITCAAGARLFTKV